MRRQPGTPVAARDPLHGRGVRLHAAGRQPAVEAAAADAAEAGARLRPRRRARHPEPGRPRLQGPRPTRAPGSSAACRPSATRRACSRAARARRGGERLDAKDLEQTLAGLGKRQFLLHNVNEEQPVVFATRWAMSYLAGPLTREQIRRLVPGRGAAAPAAPSPAAPPLRPAAAASAKRRAACRDPPVLRAGMRVCHPARAPRLPAAGDGGGRGHLREHEPRHQ